MNRTDFQKLAKTERIANFHKHTKLVFEKIDLGRLSNLNKLQIHHSSSSSGGSRYYLTELDGRVVYIRRSNHWGSFYTTEWDGDGAYSVGHNWELVGDDARKKDGTYKNTFQAGFVYID